MKKMVLIILLVVLMPTIVFAGQTSKADSNKYHALKFDTNAIFILDKNEGYMWIWVIQDYKEKKAEFLIYQGKLKAGSEMGDVIETTYKEK
jgi:hypothetical protein